MKRSSYLKAIAQFLASAIFTTPFAQEAFETKGFTAEGNFGRFYGCKKCYNRKAKGLAIEARHHRRRLSQKLKEV